MAYKVQRSNREVIEKKLLTALAEEGTTAMLCSEQDLEDLRVALSNLPKWTCEAQKRRWMNLKEGIELLLKKAYGKKRIHKVQSDTHRRDA